MNQRQYDVRKRQYAGKGKRNPVSNRSSGYRNSTYAQKYAQPDQAEHLPYAVFFRIRIFIAIMLFAFFVFLEKDVLAEEEEARIYQAMQYNISDEYEISGNGLKEYVIDTFAEIQGATQ